MESIKEKVVRLAQINATSTSRLIDQAMVDERREIVRDLAEINVIELDEVPESGRFAFTSEEWQTEYLTNYKVLKDEL